MTAPGKTLLKVISILFIIFGAIITLISLLALLGSAVLSSVGETDMLGGILLVASIILLLDGVLELVLGILGLNKCGDPAKAGYFIAVGIVLCLLSLVSMVIGIANGSFQITSLIGFVLPILYIVGGSMNRSAIARV